MILILSRQDDGTTAFVIEWLISMNKPFIRLNSDTEKMKFVSLDTGKRELIFEQNGDKVNLFDVQSVWYRRRGLSIKNILVDEKLFGQTVFRDDHRGYQRKHLQAELQTLADYMYFVLEENAVNRLGGHLLADVNKLKVLEMAKKHGLDVPATKIVTTKKQLEDGLQSEDGSITKAMGGSGVYFFGKKRNYYSYTEKLTPENVSPLPGRFFPSLVQSQIKKRFELRVFYLRGTFYAMAIFSQNDKKTAVDFRKYNTTKPNRFVPFALPEPVKEKLKGLMDELGLDTGSADLIVGRDGRYYFLEVNPIGQFSMTSIPCNYYLEKKVAELL